LFPQLPRELVDERLIGRVAQADRARDGHEHRCAIARRRKVDEEGPVLEPVDLIRSGPEGQSRFSDTAGPGEGKHPDRLVFEAFFDLLQLCGSPDESGWLVGEVACLAREGH
jgi:hypothetical protein